MSEETTTAIAKMDMAKPPVTAAGVRQLFTAMQGQIATALPKHLTAERMMRVAVTACQKNPRLLECTRESLAASLIISSQLGLEPDGVMGQGYLVPFTNRKAKPPRLECQFMPGYQGLIEMAFRNPRVRSVMPGIVHEHDHFEMQRGLEPKLEHRPPSKGDRGNVIGYYIVWELENAKPVWDYMTVEEVHKHRVKFSRASDDGPWVTDFDAMALKTVVKRTFKWIPKSVELQSALTHEMEFERQVIDVTPPTQPESEMPIASMKDLKEATRAKETQPAGPTPQDVEAAVKAKHIGADEFDGIVAKLGLEGRMPETFTPDECQSIIDEIEKGA